MPGDAGHGTGQFPAYRQVLTLAGPQKSAVGQLPDPLGTFPCGCMMLFGQVPLLH